MHYVKGTGFVDVAGKKVCSKRKMALTLARICGYENDLEQYTRLIIESRVSREMMNAEFRRGAEMKKSGVPSSSTI